MPQTWTKTDAFAHFGASGRNPQWSWSARSPDGKVVVLTMWQDELRMENGVLAYTPRSLEDVDWSGRQGNRERIENIRWALDHCEGLVRVVVLVSEDTNARVRKIKSCFPHERLVMRITEFNDQTGEFRAVSTL